MTHQQFENTIINIADQIFSIKEYSFQRRGLKFDYRRPDLMLSPCEKQRVEALENKMQEIITEFTLMNEYDEFVKNRGTKRT